MTEPNEQSPEAEFKNVPKFSEKNWTEDYLHENGMYQNKCHECHELFFGHKRRVICKECANKPLDWEKMAEKKPPTQHESWAWQGCWADGELTGFAKCMVKKVKPLEAENAALRKIVEELRPLAEVGLMYAESLNGKLPDKQAIIDRAKKLIGE
jgi:hypothetical protein